MTSPALAPLAGTVLALAALLGGCAALPGPAGGAGSPADGPGDRVRAAASVGEAVRDLPKSRRGNMAEYTVRGRRYRTLDSAAGFRERGVASWYGSKFHGRETSSGEPFDMHAMTAAHRHLPLPTFARVSDVNTGASVIVKVNDRGPFVDERVIDLSYAAALQLGMLAHGTAEVTIEALSMHAPPDPVPAPALPPAPRPASVPLPPVEPAARERRADGGAAPVVVQLGAFADADNARAFARRLSPLLGRPPDVDHDAARALYRVRTGPITDAAALERTLRALAAAGIESYALAPPP